MNELRRFFLSGIVLVITFPAAAGAQGSSATKPTRDYVDLPFDGNLAAALKEKLQTVTGRERLLDLVNEIRGNPKKYQILTKSKNLMKLGSGEQLDAAAMKELEKLVEKSAGDLKAKFAPEELEAMQHVLQQRREELEKLQPPTSKSDPSKPRPPNDKRAGALLPKVTAKGDEGATFDDLAKRTLSWMEQSKIAGLNELTQKSPAFQRSKERIVAADDPLAKALTKLNLAASGKLSWPKLDWIRIPSGASGKLRAVVPDLGSLSSPSALRLPSVSSISSGWALFILVALAAAVGLEVVVWKLLARRSRRDSQVAWKKTLGPWPVPPDKVATSAQFIQAFEYLALLLLGERALTANHRDIAVRLGTTPERTMASQELALLYERARYDPGMQEMVSSEGAIARRGLCLLAGLQETA